METARRSSQSSSNEEGGDSELPATPTTVVSDSNAEEENDVDSTAKGEKNLQKCFAKKYFVNKYNCT